MHCQILSPEHRRPIFPAQKEHSGLFLFLTFASFAVLSAAAVEILIDHEIFRSQSGNMSLLEKKIFY